ncbi:hypothetical protein JD969_19945 [Planctomycetota bacterium]|nr:hypothetical protein JD969_19945 [Planctomycetota bacterium]
MNESPIYSFLAGEEKSGKTLPIIGSLFLILLVCLVPLLMSLSRADSNRTMENITVLSAQETWLRMHGTDLIPAEPDAYLIPTRNSMPRFQKPPMAVWLDLIAYTGLTPNTDDSTPADIIYRSRLVAVAFGLVLLGTVFWIGLNLGDHKFAIIAALATGTMWFFQKQARIASYDIDLAAFAALSVASMIAAIKPFRPKPQIVSAVVLTILSGIFAAAAVLTKGWPLGLLWSYAPMIAVIILTPERRLRSSMLAIASIVIAAVIAAPWFIYALKYYPQAYNTWLGEYKASRTEFQTPFYYFALLGLVLPWPVFFFGSLFHPFVRAGGIDRRKLLLPWLWFILLFVILSIPGAKQQRYILPIIPAMGLLIAQLLRWHVSLAKNGKRDPGGDFMIHPQWIGFGVATLALIAIQFRDHFAAASSFSGDIINAPEPKFILGPAPLTFPLIGGITLIAITILGYRTHVAFKNPMKAFYLATAWFLVASTMIWSSYSASPDRDHPIRVEAEQVDSIIGDSPMYVLYQTGKTDDVNEEFLIYTQRIIPRVNISDIQQFTKSLTNKTYMITDDDQIMKALMEQFGWKAVLEFKQDKRRPNTLYVHYPPPQDKPISDTNNQ